MTRLIHADQISSTGGNNRESLGILWNYGKSCHIFLIRSKVYGIVVLFFFHALVNLIIHYHEIINRLANLSYDILMLRPRCSAWLRITNFSYLLLFFLLININPSEQQATWQNHAYASFPLLLVLAVHSSWLLLEPTRPVKKNNTAFIGKGAQYVCVTLDSKYNACINHNKKTENTLKFWSSNKYLFQKGHFFSHIFFVFEQFPNSLAKRYENVSTFLMYPLFKFKIKRLLFLFDRYLQEETISLFPLKNDEIDISVDKLEKNNERLMWFITT